MLTTTATLLFLFVTSGLAALAVHEALGSGRKRRGASNDESHQQAKLDQIESMIHDVREEHQSMATEWERRSQSFVRDGTQHEAAIAVVFQEMRNGQSELQIDLGHMNRIVADMGAQVVDSSRSSASIAEVKALLERVETVERSLQGQDLRLCALDQSVTGLEDALAPDDSDLKRIKGIGVTLEQTLKGLGVETIDQVANLSIDQIEELSEKLGNFASRIERDAWVNQAKALQRS